MKRQNWPRKKQDLTEQEKYEKDFKQFSLLTLRMIAQSEKYPRQLRRLKVMCNFLSTEIKNFEEKKLEVDGNNGKTI